MTKLTILLASTAALAGCATQPMPAPAVAPMAETAPPMIEPVGPKAAIGSFGFDKAGMDTNVVPGNNFYDYANGTWAKNTAIPADKSNYGMFTLLDDLSRERTKSLIETAAQDPSSRIGAVYASFMDQARIESKGLTPIQPWLGQIRGLKSKVGLASLYAAAGKIGVSTPFGGTSGRMTRIPRNISCRSASRAWACRTATITSRPTPRSSRRAASISSI